jgi:hypothetical protein
VISGVLFLLVLLRGHRTSIVDLPEFRFSQPVHAPGRLPVALNSYASRLTLTIGVAVIVAITAAICFLWESTCSAAGARAPPEHHASYRTVTILPALEQHPKNPIVSGSA